MLLDQPKFIFIIVFTVSQICKVKKLSPIDTFLLANSKPIVTLYSLLKMFYVYLNSIEDFPTP